MPPTARLDREIEAKYEVLAKMGEGGMGAVYKVRHKVFQDVRVIKTAKYQDNPAEKTRFISEAKRGYHFNHDSIAKVFDFDITTEGTAYIVMEYIDGLNVRQVLAQSGGVLELRRAIDIALQTLGALQYLHERGVVHRDISPENLMLTRDEEGKPLVKLIDLGIAKSMASQSLTLAGKFIGKVVYASPEQFSGNVDQRSDLYSLGIVLYELLTGSLPVGSNDYRAVIAAHISGELRSFDETDPQGRIPLALRAVVMRALKREVQDRFQSATEFATTLRSVGKVVVEKTMTIEIAMEDMAAEKASRSERIAWEGALAADSPKAWDDFLSRYPSSALSASARARLEELEQIEEMDWNEAASAETTPAWQAYLQKHPESPRASRARRRLEKIEVEAAERNAWDLAASGDSVAAWELFLRTYPESKRGAEARERLAATREREAEERAWMAAVRGDTLAAWREYVTKYKQSARVGEAAQRLKLAEAREAEARDWDLAAKANSAESWQQYLDQHPQSSRRAEAEQRREAIVRAAQEEAAWTAAQRADSTEAWREYLRAHGSSQRAAQASRRLAVAELREGEQRDWINAGAIDTVEGWREYLSKHPDARPDAARGRLAAAERAAEESQAWSAAEREGSSAAWRQYLDRFGTSHRAADAQQRLATAEERELTEARARQSEQQAFSEAERADTVEAWNDFVSRHPQSARLDVAKSRLVRARESVDAQRRKEEARRAAAEQQAWTRAKSENSVDQWELFLKEWPSSPRANEAKLHLEDARAAVARDQALRAGTAEAFEQFVQNYSKSRYAEEVRKKLEILRAEQRRLQKEAAERERAEAGRKEVEERRWSAAVKRNTVAELEEFIRAYPQSARAAEARQRIAETQKREREAAVAAEERTWSAAVKADTIPQFEKFQRAYPQSAHVAEARQRISDIEARGRKAAEDAARAKEVARAEAARKEAEAARAKEAARAEAARKEAEERRAKAAARAAQAAAKSRPAEAPPVFTVDNTSGATVAHPAWPLPLKAGAGITVLAIAVAVGVYWEFSRPEVTRQPVQTNTDSTRPPVPPPPSTGQLVINAFPWGEVKSVKDDTTKTERVPAGQPLYTPVTLALPPGAYSVVLTNPNSRKTERCSVVVQASQRVRCEKSLDSVDPNEYLRALAQPQQ